MPVNFSEDPEKALRMVREAKDLVYDTETSGLDWRYNAPVGYVIGAGARETGIRQEDVVYIPIRHGGGGNLAGGRPMAAPDGEWEIHPFERELAKAFDYRNQVGVGPIIGHHIKFDCHMSANAGIMLGRRMVCTQDHEAILDEYSRSYSLENCAERRGVEPKKGEALYAMIARLVGGAANRKIMEHFWRTPGSDELVVDYSTGDGVTTLQLHYAQLDKLEEEELGVVAQLESDLIWTCFRMERKGVRVDMAYADELRQATEDRVTEAMRSLPVGFNPRSPVQMKELMDANGLTDYPTTEKGNPSFTEKWLKTNDIGKTIIEIRQATNLVNSFINPLAERHVYKGRVHATFNQLKSDDTGTISGRFSCNAPNLQQVPKRIKELAKPFRRLFIADEGYVFWERDYSQCEPRLFAHYSQDPNLIEGYNSKPFRDAHQVVADLLQVERDPTAKRMNMGIFTGMQPKSFAGHMGWELDRATVAFNQWFQEFPDIRKFQDKAKARLKNRGYVMTLLGRRCRLEHPRFAYRGTSKIIQGGNADIMKWKLREADRMCEDAGDICQILITVHDSYEGQYQDTPEGRKVFDEMVAEMREVQTEPFNLSVPFEMDGFEGANWSEATFGVK